MPGVEVGLRLLGDLVRVADDRHRASRSRGTPRLERRLELRLAPPRASAPMKTRAMRVLVISAGSRPTSSQWRSSTPSRCWTRSTSPNRLQPSRVLGDEPQRLALAAAADQDRDVAAQRLRVVERAVDAVVRALDGRSLLGEHRARDLQRVLEALEALLQRREANAVGVVLLLEPGGADAEAPRGRRR